MGIEDNIAARLAAEQIAGLADDEAKIYGDRFWKELASIINAHVPFPAVRRNTEKAGPMCDKESRLFGQQTLMPFGEFAGMKIDDVPLGRLEWYADQTFMEGLRRYLQSDRVKQERG